MLLLLQLEQLTASASDASAHGLLCSQTSEPRNTLPLRVLCCWAIFAQAAADGCDQPEEDEAEAVIAAATESNTAFGVFTKQCVFSWADSNDLTDQAVR